MRNEVASVDRFSLYHSWASASALQYPKSESCNGKHSRVGLGPLIAVPDWFRHLNSFSFRYRTHWMPDSPAFSKTVPRCKGVHPARPYYWWWCRDTLHVHTACGGETPCTSMLVVVERHPARPYCL